MNLKEIFRTILRGTTLMTLFVIFIGAIGYLYKWVEMEETIFETIFWGVACFLTSLKIALINEDF